MLVSTVVSADLDDDDNDDATDVADVDIVGVELETTCNGGTIAFNVSSGPSLRCWSSIIPSSTSETVWFGILLSSSSTGSVAALVPNIPSMSS